MIKIPCFDGIPSRSTIRSSLACCEEVGEPKPPWRVEFLGCPRSPGLLAKLSNEIILESIKLTPEFILLRSIEDYITALVLQHLDNCW